MTALSARIRPGERYEVAAAFTTALLVMVAHAQLETARDTLFLTNVAPARLPWVYLVIAALSVLGGPILGRPGSDRLNRRTLVAMQIIAAVGTAAFLPPWPSRQKMFYALYIWGGLAAAVILTRFWLILGNRLTASQAKRLFPVVASGTVAGSLLGFGGGGLVAAQLGPRALLLGSAVAFLASAVSATVWWKVPQPRERSSEAQSAAQAAEADRRWDNLKVAVRHVYVRRLGLVLLLASVGVTLSDFVFKTAVAHAVPVRHLGTFLATAYFAFDVASLLLLLVAVSPLIRMIGAPLGLAVRPLSLLAGGLMLFAGGGFAVALGLRGVDGALRWSLHKTASELLYVPLAPRLRAAVKEISDLLAQRGGQALGSLLILGCLATAAPPRWIGAVLALCAAAWVGLAWGLRRPYLSLFRETLNEASADIRLEFPELDVASLEHLLAALNSPEETRVIAALDLLAATGRAHVIPALILYHPSPTVVARALELFTAVGRRDVLPFVPALSHHADAAVRAAAVRAWAAMQPDAEPLQRAMAAADPIVATTALISAAARGALSPDAAAAAVRRALPAEGAAADPRPFVARALRDRPAAAFAPLLVELATARAVETRREALLALGALRDPAHLPLLIDQLGERSLRDAAARTLLAYGPPGLAALEAALGDERLPYGLRVHIPRAVARFGHQRAADILLARLRVEPGGRLRYKLLRALGRLMTEVAGLHLDETTLDGIADDHLAKAFQNLHWLTVLREGAAEVPARRTVGHRLLLELLAQRQAFAVERLFRVLGLRAPEEDVSQLYDNLYADDPATHAAARELLEQLLPQRWRAAVLALVDDAPDAARLAAGASFFAVAGIEYDDLLRELATHPSDAVAALATYHAVELGVIDRAATQPLDVSTNWVRGWRQPAPGRTGAAAIAAPLPAEAAAVADELVWAVGGRT